MQGRRARAAGQAGRSALEGAASRVLPGVWGLDADTTAARTWTKGAEGEAATARLLAQLPRDYTVLHDRAIVESEANLDHVVIGPNGVFLIDSKNFAGKVAECDGEWFQGSRPLASTLEVAVWEARMLSALLATPVQTVLCIHGAQLPAPVSTAVADGISVAVLGPDDLVPFLRSAPLDPAGGDVGVARRLARKTLPAAGVRRGRFDLARLLGPRDAERMFRYAARQLAGDVRTCRALADGLAGSGAAPGRAAPDLSRAQAELDDAHAAWAQEQIRAADHAQAAADEHCVGFGTYDWDGDWAGPAGATADDADATGLQYVGDVVLDGLPGDPRRAPLAVPFLGSGHVELRTSTAGGRRQALELVRGLLLRAVAGSPPGTVNIDVYDPQGVAEGLAPFEELGGGKDGLFRRIGRKDLVPALDALTGHVTKVLAAPDADDPAGYAGLRERLGHGRHTWRILVVLGLPDGSSGAEARTVLRALAEQGPRAGVHVLAVLDPADGDSDLPGAVVFEDRDPWWTSPTYGSLVAFAAGPPDMLIREVSRAAAIGAAGRAGTSEPLASVLAGTPGHASSAAGLEVAIGQDDRGAPVVLRFDDDTVHALIGGSAGSGKSNLMLTTIYGLAHAYDPSQLQLYLLDFKEGLEFARFVPDDPAEPWLPHARSVGLNSDRDFGLAMLDHLIATMNERAALLKRHGASSVTSLRQSHPDVLCPRILCVVDEFQVLLQPDDAIAKKAVDHLSTLARKGRAYGLHVVLASQTLSGISALWGQTGSIFDQFRTRIALKTSAGESQVILGPLNTAAADITRRGAAVFNGQGGNPDANQAVKVAHADPAGTSAVQARAHAAWGASGPRPYVFDSDAPAHLEDADLAGPHDDTAALVGVRPSVARTVSAIAMPPEAGRNIAVLGNGQPEAEGVLAAAARSLTATAVEPPKVVAVDCTSKTPNVDWPFAAALAAAGTAVDQRGADDLRDLLAAFADALDGDGYLDPTVLVLSGLHRITGLNRRAPSGRNAADDLRTVLRTGPAAGVHTLGWWASPKRFTEDVGPAGRDDIAAYVVLKAQAADLTSILGHGTAWTPRPNRALVWDRDRDATPHLVVPFALPDHEAVR